MSAKPVEPKSISSHRCGLCGKTDHYRPTCPLPDLGVVLNFHKVVPQKDMVADCLSHLATPSFVGCDQVDDGSSPADIVSLPTLGQTDFEELSTDAVRESELVTEVPPVSALEPAVAESAQRFDDFVEEALPVVRTLEPIVESEQPFDLNVSSSSSKIDLEDENEFLVAEQSVGINSSEAALENAPYFLEAHAADGYSCGILADSVGSPILLKKREYGNKGVVDEEDCGSDDIGIVEQDSAESAHLNMPARKRPLQSPADVPLQQSCSTKSRNVGKPGHRVVLKWKKCDVCEKSESDNWRFTMVNCGTCEFGYCHNNCFDASHAALPQASQSSRTRSRASGNARTFRCRACMSSNQ